MVVCVLPNNRKDRYDALKVFLCVEDPGDLRFVQITVLPNIVWLSLNWHYFICAVISHRQHHALYAWIMHHELTQFMWLRPITAHSVQMKMSMLRLQGAEIKSPQLIFVHDFIKGQQILMQSSLLDLKIKGHVQYMDITHLT